MNMEVSKMKSNDILDINIPKEEIEKLAYKISDRMIREFMKDYNIEDEQKARKEFAEYVLIMQRLEDKECYRSEEE